MGTGAAKVLKMIEEIVFYGFKNLIKMCLS